MQAKVVISQDLSGVGQVSMGVALPLIAALGHDPLALPTLYYPPILLCQQYLF